MLAHVDEPALGAETFVSPAIESLQQAQSPAPRATPQTAGSPRARLPIGAYLEIEHDGSRTVVPLSDAATHIGRGMSADVTIDDMTVSRRHALIVRRGGRTLVLDDRSLNGVHVNGRRVTEAPLADGDVIVLGRVVIGYRDVR